MVGIYKITSPSGKVYIGQTWNFYKRMKDYRNLKHGKQLKLFNSFQKYGFDSHEMKIIHELPHDVSQETLNTYEQVYMDAYRNCGIELMNLREAGSNGKLSDELKRRLSEVKQGIGKGRKQSDEWVKKRTAVQFGNTNWLGKNHSDDTKEKMSAVSIGKPKSEDHAKKCAENGRIQAIKNQKPVIQLSKSGEFIKEWSSAKEAEDNSIALARSICHACKGKYHSAGGFKWQYKKIE